MGAGGRRQQPAVKDGRGGRLLRQRRLRQREEKATGSGEEAREEGQRLGSDDGCEQQGRRRWARLMSLSVETVAGVGLQLAEEEGRGQRQYGEGCGSGRGRRLWRQREERPTVVTAESKGGSG
ncbi:hypothetical protein BHE74_00044238 [Ensete ventricosum]|nr:hypothetical protein BHE74_00044238 [Ensete ventricosum]